MSNDEKKLLYDVKESILSIDEHLSGKRDFDLYKRNKTVRRAVERELEIIGEAVSKLIKIDPGIKISYSRQIIDFRNRVIHAYDNIDNEIIWSVVVNHLPVLEAEVAGLLDI